MTQRSNCFIITILLAMTGPRCLVFFANPESPKQMSNLETSSPRARPEETGRCSRGISCLIEAFTADDIDAKIQDCIDQRPGDTDGGFWVKMRGGSVWMGVGGWGWLAKMGDTSKAAEPENTSAAYLKTHILLVCVELVPQKLRQKDDPKS